MVDLRDILIHNVVIGTIAAAAMNTADITNLRNEVVELVDPLATDVAEQWKTNESEAIRTAKEWTLQYARE
ncbi:hypothetical protein KIN20_024559 [Parelaphostrongylus tenuis]|uniref:Uncharacterized protein n=1 Tax=Parelaphostrongylus tenuis TaxID=148309 RepID=A0AAD5NB93_PARTN|nr:hypothetical protein KIN20_024559 [Parelaphostrongylus tenuis]